MDLILQVVFGLTLFYLNAQNLATNQIKLSDPAQNSDASNTLFN